jgi:hypothetical protein
MAGGAVIDEPNNKHVAVNGLSGPRIEQFLPKHQDTWVAAIEQVVAIINAHPWLFIFLPGPVAFAQSSAPTSTNRNPSCVL